MNSDLILMIILVVALILGNLWLLKRNNKSFQGKHRASARVSQNKKSSASTSDVTAVDTSKSAQNHQQHSDHAADDGGGGD